MWILKEFSTFHMYTSHILLIFQESPVHFANKVLILAVFQTWQLVDMVQ